MNIKRIAEYAQKPSLFSNGTSIMWTDPYIAQQLLECHINPDNDMASRSSKKVELLVDWILGKARKEQMDILDLGCGPGLYAEKFAQHGHNVTGVDFSRNSIEYAQKNANEKGLRIEYVCDNYLNIKYENKFDLVVLIYLDFCVLKPEERKIVLGNINRALKKNGVFIFDVVNGKNIQAKILNASWEVCSTQGFWKNEPYVALNNGYHYPKEKVLLNQHIIMDEKDNIDTYLFWSSYFDVEEMESLLHEAKFKNIHSFENVLPNGDAWNGDNVTFYKAEKE